jgi:multimeric flavodoxin WrbA
MKNILAIIGSPRKGQTCEAVQLVEKELLKHGEVRVEYLMLRELGLKECYGCHNCILKGEEFCPEREKIGCVMSKIQSADGIILASPVYNDHVTALLKKLFDFMTFLWHRPALFGKPFMGVSTGGGMFKNVFHYLKTNVNSWGGTWVCQVGVPHFDALTDTMKEKIKKSLQKESAVFYKAVQQPALPVPSFSRLMWFNMWRMNAEVCKESNPKDFRHWTDKGWFGKAYYTDVKVPFVRRILANMAMSIGRSFMRKVYKGY